MKANDYKLIMRCIEEGIECGIHRAYKHTDEPSREQLIDAVERAITFEICEWFVFGDEE